jgi:hypothetical protein
VKVHKKEKSICNMVAVPYEVYLYCPMLGKKERNMEELNTIVEAVKEFKETATEIQWDAFLSLIDVISEEAGDFDEDESDIED